MGSRQCNECKEMVDEARAFCQGCGNPLVVEVERTESSSFERSTATVQFGQTLFGEILSDLGLDISKAPQQEETPAPVAMPVRTQVVAPVATVRPVQTRPESPKPSGAGANPSGSSKVMWWILGVLGGVLLLLVALFVGGALFYFLWARSS
jgi:hypothetical protein